MFKPEWNDALIYCAICTFLLDPKASQDKERGFLLGAYRGWYALLNKETFLKYASQSDPIFSMLTKYDTSDIARFKREDLLIYGAGLVDLFDERDDELTKKIRILKSRYGSIKLPMLTS